MACEVREEEDREMICSRPGHASQPRHAKLPVPNIEKKKETREKVVEAWDGEGEREGEGGVMCVQMVLPHRRARRKVMCA